VYFCSDSKDVETLLKTYDVSSTTDKGESRGVIEYTTPLLGKKRAGVFVLEK